MCATAAGVGPAGRAAAWLGGVVFVGSLLYFVYVYAVQFGTTDARRFPSGGFARPLLANIVLFSAFALHHSVMARARAKRWLERYVPPPLERTVYVWIASVLFIVTCGWWRDLPGLLYALPSPWHLVGWGIQGFGLWLIVDAARVIDVLDLAGIRQATGRRSSAALQSRGAYGLVRHPIYLGWALLTFGVPVMTATRFSFAFISTLYLVVAIPFEERSLVAAFGETYAGYQRQVRWRMIPGVY
jgi:protein-S-isoprenylcysteine O-methyltransferase Ste14